MTTEPNSQDSITFQILTTRSLNIILTDPTERIIPKPNDEFIAGNQLPRKYYGQFVPEEMACVPLQEIDPAYENLKTFIVIGKHGTINRYSAGNSLEALGPLNPVRQWALFLTTHWAFSIFMAAIVVLNTVFVVNDVGKIYVNATTIIYAIEFLLKIISEGLIRGPFTYLRKPWNWLDIVVIFTSLIRPFKTVSALYWTRILKLMQLTPEIRRAFKLITRTIWNLRPALLFSLFIIFLFSLIGKLRFLGIFTNRCINSSDYWELLSISSTSNDTQVQAVSWKDFAQNRANWFSNEWCFDENDENLMECNEDDGFECISGAGTNPDFGFTNFDTIRWSVVQTVRIIYQDYLDSILNQLTHASASPSATILYFAAMFLFGTYALGTLAYAIVGTHIFDFLQQKFDINCVQDQVEKIMESSSSAPPSDKDHVLFFVHNLLNSVIFEVAITSTILLDILALSMQHHNMPSFSNHFSKWMIRVAMIIYTIEFVLKMYLVGPRRLILKGWNIFDFVTLVDMYLQVLYKKYYISFPLRVFKLTLRWNTLHLTFKITVECLKTLWGLGGLFIILGAFFALIGMSEFSQSYLRNKHLFKYGIIPRWNFSNFLHSVLVVFRIWIGEFIEMLGQCLLVQDRGCIIYFSSVAVTGFIILMALTVGVVFVTDKILKSTENMKPQPSILAKMFCYPYVWIKLQAEADPLPPVHTGSSRHNFRATTSSSPNMEVDKRKIIFCSPKLGGSQVLRGVCTFIILVFSIVLALDDIPHKNDINVESFVYAVDVVFTVFISIMTVYSLVVLGLKQCVTSPGWIFDIFVILEMIINLLCNLKHERNPHPMFYVFRSLRPFMLVSRIETLEIVFRGLLRELRYLWKFLVVGIFIWLYFAILGVKMFSGTFSKCIDDKNESSSLMSNSKQCMAINHTWEISDLNFDRVGKSFISLALISKRSSGISILFDSTDFHSPVMNSQERELKNFYFILTFFVCGIFLMPNIIFGVLYYNLNKLTGYFLTKEQMTKSEVLPKLPLGSVHTKPIGKYRTKVYNFVSNVYFDAVSLAVIILDAICFAWTDAEDEFWNEYFSIPRQIRAGIIFLYVMELAFKLVGWGKSYFHTGWNQFDFLVVVSCVTEMMLQKFSFSTWIIMDFLRILRLLRIFQFQPLIKRGKTLRHYFAAFKKFSLGFRNVLIFHCLIMYSYSLIGVRKFGHVKLAKGLDEYFSFRTVGSSFRVLFVLSSMAGVDGILPALTEENECTPDGTDIVFHHGDCGSMFWGTFYVFSYSLFSFLTFTNLYMLFIFEIIEQLKKRSKQSSSTVRSKNEPTTTNSLFQNVDSIKSCGLQNA